MNSDQSMERVAYMMKVRSDKAGGGKEGVEVDYRQFAEYIHKVTKTVPPEAGSSFTALLELPANQAIELLHLSGPVACSSEPASGEHAWNAPSVDHRRPYSLTSGGSSAFPLNASPVERAANRPVFADSTEKTFAPSKPANCSQQPKHEPTETDSFPDSPSPLISGSAVRRDHPKTEKRKERETKVPRIEIRVSVKGPTKKSRIPATVGSTGAEKLPYVHVRARRGQATDSHSLAERARRDKINARMKLLRDLVPGCNKITGTALLLDEIINHVQSLQRHVELLSMRLAAADLKIDSNLERLLAGGSESQTDSRFFNMVMPLVWPNFPLHENIHQYQHQWPDVLHRPVWERSIEDDPNFFAP